MRKLLIILVILFIGIVGFAGYVFADNADIILWKLNFNTEEIILNTDATGLLISNSNTVKLRDAYVEIQTSSTPSLYLNNGLLSSSTVLITGYASSTIGFFTQGDLHIGGNSTFDGTITNGTSTDLIKMTAGVFSDVGDPVKNYVPIFNGSTVVWAAQGTTFTFSIATFTDNATYSQEIGTGDAIAIGGISFSATYSNGPATSGSVQIVSGTTAWGSALTLTGGSFEGPTTNTEAVTYPASAGTTVRFRLTAGDGTDTDTDDTTIVYNNQRFWGVTTETSSFSEAEVEGLAGSELSNSKDKSFSNTTGSGEYILWASRTALGTVTFSVGGFSGGFQAPETLSITNASGYTENYYVYRSTNSNLGTITVTAN